MEDQANDLIVIIMMIRRIRMRLEVVVRTRGELIPIISIEIKEEEAKDKDLKRKLLWTCFHCREEGHREFECSQCQGRME